MTTHQFNTELWLPLPRQEVFAFFAEPRNLEGITPPWLKFRIATTGPLEMKRGAIIDYRLRLHGLPIRWRSEITVWDPPHRFVDEQRRGPYRLWVHDHRFEAYEGETRIIDEVLYAVPGGALIDRLFVAGDVRRIFDYRERAIRELLLPRAEGS